MQETPASARSSARQADELTAAAQQADDQAQRVEALSTARVVTDEELIAARAARAQGHARLESARSLAVLGRIRLGYTTVRAPIAGVVASATTHEGETVAASLAAPTFVTLIEPTQLE